MNTNNIFFYTKADILDNFDQSTIKKGYDCLADTRVISYGLDDSWVRAKDDNFMAITGSVSNSRGRDYDVMIAVFSSHEDATISIDSECSCSEEYGCNHAVAILLKILQDHPTSKEESSSARKNQYKTLRQNAAQLRRSQLARQQSLKNWANVVDIVNKEKDGYKNTSVEAIVYTLKLSPQGHHKRLAVSIGVSRALKKGGYGKPKDYSENSAVSVRARTKSDVRFIALLRALTEYNHGFGECFYLYNENIHDFFPELIKTGRVFWNGLPSEPIMLGPEKRVELKWDILPDGRQRLIGDVENLEQEKKITILPVVPLWYYEKETNTCGPLNSPYPEVVLSSLSMPPIKRTEIKAAKRALSTLFPHVNGLPEPKLLKKEKIATKAVKKNVTLRLFSEKSVAQNQYQWKYGYYLPRTNSCPLAMAELQFNYGGSSVGLNDPTSVVLHYQNSSNHLLEIDRDEAWEEACVEKLIEKEIIPCSLKKDFHVHEDHQFCFFLNKSNNEDELLEKFELIQEIVAKNRWQLNIDESFPIKAIDKVDEWYSDLGESPQEGIDWFSLTLGVLVNGKKINLLPLLVKLIREKFKNFDSQTISALPNDSSCALRLESGRYITVPFERIRGILLVLCELFSEQSLDENGALKLSKLQSGLLTEVSKAMGVTNLRWFGGEKLRKLGEKLNDFDGIKVVSPPEEFKANLRGYQREGLNWLQFLREYNLGGILADDMGLGKTIQTLAHLSLEKSEKRLDKPSLLIVPTSLISNWSFEANRFSPKLSVLILHGSKRKEEFNKIKKFDLIISTYPLAIRDKDILLSIDYYYLILDEAQQIKNSKAKITQILLQIQAKHRLCLTGTPMENHLGELWSIFNFVSPGVLGEGKQFKQVFRIPIERDGNSERHKQLLKRIKPFMLRRKKDDVVKELPKKTEIIRKIEITGAQRDLYESVRLSMEKNVRDAIAQKGINRNQILILSALLKLRQICCSPTLLKLKSVKKTLKSAKLDDLMTFLPELLEEGRRILLFSSFTSMLSLIEEALKKRKIDFVKLTGRTKDRKTPVEAFQKKEVPLFLISLKAGGMGLNLTAADTVIHYDPWWNPAAENQATDRAHRIGQTKPVFIYKLITEGTVEEKILEMQEKKRKLILGIVKSDAKKQNIHLTQKDLNVLFEPINRSSI